MSTTTPNRLTARVITPTTNILHMPAEIIGIILELFLIDGGSLVLFTHVHLLFRAVALSRTKIWARIPSISCTDAGYDRLETFLQRTGIDWLLDIEFDPKFCHVKGLDAVSHVKQLCRFWKIFEPLFFRIERLTLSGGPYATIMATAFLIPVINTASSLVHLDIRDFEYPIAWVDSLPAAMRELESLILTNDSLRWLSHISMPTLQSLTVLGSIIPPLFDFLRLCSTTLVDLRLMASFRPMAEFESPVIGFPCLRELSVKIGPGEHCWDKFDAPVIERISVEFSLSHPISSALLQFLRHHSPSLKKISLRCDSFPIFADSIDIEPFSFPTLEELFMSFPYMGFVLGQIRSAPALMNLKIGPSKYTCNVGAPDTSIPQIYPSLNTISIDDHINLLQLISAPVLTNITIKGEELGDNPHFTDFLRRHTNTVIQLCIDSTSRKNPSRPRNSRFAPPRESVVPLETLSFPCLEILDVTLDGSLSKIQGATMPALDQFIMRSYCGDSPQIRPPAPWNATGPSLELLRHLFDVSTSLSHVTICDTLINDPWTSIWVMDALAESRNCASLMTVDVAMPLKPQAAHFYAALKRLVNAHHDATTLKFGRIKLARRSFFSADPDQETCSWLEQNIEELIIPSIPDLGHF